MGVIVLRTRRISAATSLAVLFSSVVLVGGAANPAAADSSKVLPAASVGDIVADGVHKRVFISDPTGGKVLVTDYNGAVVGTIASLPGVTGLELSADSGTLYAAVPGADAIVTIDTAGLKESARYATGEGTDPKHPALAGGKLWFGYGAAGEGNIGSLDLSGAEPVVTLDQDKDRTWFSAPTLASAPGAPGTLAAGIETQSPAELAVYDVASGTATRTAHASVDGGNMRDLALSPDGKQIVVASAAPSLHQAYNTADLSRGPRTRPPRTPTRSTSPRTARSPRVRPPGTTRTSTSTSPAAPPSRSGRTSSPTPGTAAARTPCWTRGWPGRRTPAGCSPSPRTAWASVRCGCSPTP